MQQEIRRVVKEHYSTLFSTLYSRFRDIDLVEDGLQDTFEKALVKWQDDPPRDPAAWLYIAAKNRILDILKKNNRFTNLVLEEGEYDLNIEAMEEGRVLDEQFRLMCMCCHPSLAERVQVLLTLKLVAGLTTEEIAAALVMKPKTIGQSITRAKAKIKLAGIPFKTPDQSHLTERLVVIQKILYLLFNEGYHSNSEHSLYRIDLCKEAIRLSELLVSLHSDDNESEALLCLMLYQHSRSSARSTADGQPVLLKDQNRTLWNRKMIRRADVFINRIRINIRNNRAGPYAFQAAIAAEHAHAETFENNNWHHICWLYSELFLLKPDPIILLSWLGAESYRSSPAHALELMERHRLEQHLKDYRWFYSSRGELYSKSGETDKAVADLEHALSLTRNPGERRFLERRLKELKK